MPASPADTPPYQHPVVYTRTLLGLDAHPVSVECHVANGLPSTTIVGLPEGAVREARDRVRSALKNSGFEYPDGNVIINLAPGGLTKSSTALDLPIAMSVLAATEQVRYQHLTSFEFLGELGLFGELRNVAGALACAMAAWNLTRTLVIPAANRTEAQVAPRGSIALADNLQQVVQGMNSESITLNKPQQRSLTQSTSPPNTNPKRLAGEAISNSFTQVVGQQAAKRALAIAAAGGHHLLMVGPPGTGKTMLARGFAELLPPLTAETSLEVAAVYSAAGMTRQNYQAIPFRDPHHSASAPALVGGGNPPMPGEIALAHQGVLFLDELPHFRPSALNLLREPIETGTAVITRAKYKVAYPCRFQLIAAMNPCPAGRTCSEQACRCTTTQVQRYQSRISGPLLDRIDIQVRVPALPEALLSKLETVPVDDNLGPLKLKVEEARKRQLARQHCVNAVLSGEGLRQHMANATIDQAFLQQAISRYKLSARSYHKIWRIARTIADMEDIEVIEASHMVEALSYRALDWEGGVA